MHATEVTPCVQNCLAGPLIFWWPHESNTVSSSTKPLVLAGKIILHRVYWV